MGGSILGISAFYHDSAACLVVDGSVVAAAQEERFTRRKHDSRFPTHAIDYCLREGGLAGPSALDSVVFYDKPLLKFERLLETYLRLAPAGLSSFLQSMPLWLGRKLSIRELVRRELGYPGTILFTEHHEAHAASAFFPSPFSRAAILTVDGVGEWTTVSVGIGEQNRIRILREIHFPHSLGLLYSAFTYFTGFKVNSGEYKLMGLAPYGRPVYQDLIERELIDLRPDGSFKLNLRYFNYCAGLTMTNRRFAGLFGGPPRRPEGPLTEREMDLAASIQAVTEKAMLGLVRAAHAATGCENLVLAGGVALNCVANGRIVREGPFREVWIQPAAGDAGGALGAALFVHHQLRGGARDVDGRHDLQKASLLGPAFDDGEIQRFLAKRGVPARRYEDLDALVDRVSELLAEGRVIGWFQGRMEFGPRALGCRSILGDARDPEMQTNLNLKIKFRESFRPFAPSVLAERAGEYFDLAPASPYMLLVAPVRSDRLLPTDQDGRTGLERRKVIRSVIPAVTHLDNSARIQTVSREDNPGYHRLIERFAEKTGCPVIVNTSFNVRGEPIVCTPGDAYRCFTRTGIDFLVLGSWLVDKSELNLPRLDEGREQGSVGHGVMGAGPADRPRGSGEAAVELRNARRFALVLAGILLGLGLLAQWKHHPGRAGACVSAAALAPILAYAAYPVWIRFFRTWMKLAAILGWVMTRVILSVFFYALLTPFGLVSRLFRDDPLDVSWKRRGPSYWIEKPPPDPDRAGYDRQY